MEHCHFMMLKRLLKIIGLLQTKLHMFIVKDIMFSSYQSRQTNTFMEEANFRNYFLIFGLTLRDLLFSTIIFWFFRCRQQDSASSQSHTKLYNE